MTKEQQEEAITMQDWTPRDQFAMGAMMGLCANPNTVSMQDMMDIAEGVKGGKYITYASYAIADAMLKQRSKA